MPTPAGAAISQDHISGMAYLSNSGVVYSPKNPAATAIMEGCSRPRN